MTKNLQYISVDIIVHAYSVYTVDYEVFSALQFDVDRLLLMLL